MKIKAFTTLGFSLLTLLSANAETVTEKSTEVSKGELDVSKLVRQGTKPVVSWNITLSETLKDIIKFKENGQLEAKTDLIAKVTVLGTGVTSSTKYGYKSYRTKGQLRIGDNNWKTVHDGDEDAVKPGKVVYETVVKSGQSLKFKAAYYNDGWKDFRREYTDEVLTLKNGDKIPSNKPTNEAVSSAEDFLKPVLNKDGTISIGDLDVIYVAELTHTNKSSSGYDLQDLIIHVSFSKVEKDQ